MSIISFFSVGAGFQPYCIRSDFLSEPLKSAAVGNNDGFYFNVSVGERIDYVICLSKN